MIKEYPSFLPEMLNRNDKAIIRLARSICRNIGGEKKCNEFPFLADALEEAGCIDQLLLNHCRDTTITHICQCPILEAILGNTLSKDEYVIEVDHDAFLGALIAEGKFNLISPEITEVNFSREPHGYGKEERISKLFYFPRKMSLGEIIFTMGVDGWFSANMRELIAFSNNFPSCLNYLIWILFVNPP